MRKALLFVLSIMVATAVVITTECAYAQVEDPWVRLTNVDGDETDTFEVNEIVVIEGYCSRYPYDIEAYDPDGNFLWSDTSNTASYGPTEVSEITPHVGDNYYIVIQYNTWTYNVGWYFVIPDISTWIAMAASFIALIGFWATKLPRLRFR